MSLKTNKNPTKYESWSKKDGGSDNMTPIGRLIYFLTKNEGEMIKDYTDRSTDGLKISKVSILNLCSEYFKSKGVIRTADIIKTKLNTILNKKYVAAYKLWVQSGENKTAQLEDKLNKICPEFFKLHEFLDPKKTPSPDPMDSTQPVIFSDDEEIGHKNKSKNINNKDISWNSTDEGIDSSEESSVSVRRSRARKRRYAEAKIDEIVKEESKKAAKKINKAMKFMIDDKLQVYAKVQMYEIDKRSALERAQLFRWSEERLDEEWKKIDNKYKNN